MGKTFPSRFRQTPNTVRHAQQEQTRFPRFGCPIRWPNLSIRSGCREARTTPLYFTLQRNFMAPWWFAASGPTAMRSATAPASTLSTRCGRRCRPRARQTSDRSKLSLPLLWRRPRAPRLACMDNQEFFPRGLDRFARGLLHAFRCGDRSFVVRARYAVPVGKEQPRVRVRHPRRSR